MVDALVPSAGSLWEVGIVLGGIGGRAKGGVLSGLGVLRHVENVALTIASELVHELRKRGGAGKVDVRIRLGAVAVAARNDELIPLAGKRSGFTILFPVPQAVELKRVDELAIDGEELIHENIMAFAPDPVEVPDRMVEDD